MAGLISGCGTTCTPFSVRGDDYYASPAEAPAALLEHYDVPDVIHEPACGDGAIVDVLRAAGRVVYASDLVDRGCPDSYVSDFLTQKTPQIAVEACITNPPYRYAAEFVRKSRELYPLTIMLLRLAFLESARRSDILDAGDLETVLLFSKRLPFMHRAGYTGKKNSNSGMPFAFFVWKRDHLGPTTIRRITYKKQPPRQVRLDFRLAPTPIEAYIQEQEER
jgi:hypothetical protein